MADDGIASVGDEIEALLILAEPCWPVVIDCEGHAYCSSRIQAVNQEAARAWMLDHDARYPGIDCRFRLWLPDRSVGML